MRGRDATDGPLGALIRLVAQDGGDDELAGIAIVHMLEGGIGRLVRFYSDLSEDVEAVVVGAMWEQIRTFPWRRRTHSYAAILNLDTRRDVRRMLLLDRRRFIVVPPDELVLRDAAPAPSRPIDGATWNSSSCWVGR